MPSLIAGRLPVRLTPLVGRQGELRDVINSMSRSRLLTLTGPGGIGKTRLALAAAGAASASYPGGVCWVELAPLDDPGIVALVVARQLGVPDCLGQDAAAAIAEHVGDRSILIVLDNCEHVPRCWQAPDGSAVTGQVVTKNANGAGNIAERKSPSGGSRSPLPGGRHDGLDPLNPRGSRPSCADSQGGSATWIPAHPGGHRTPGCCHSVTPDYHPSYRDPL